MESRDQCAIGADCKCGPCSCTDCGKLAGINTASFFDKCRCYITDTNQRENFKTPKPPVIKSASETDTKGERKTKNNEKKQSCWEWFKSLFGFGKVEDPAKKAGSKDSDPKSSAFNSSDSGKYGPAASAPCSLTAYRVSPCGCGESFEDKLARIDEFCAELKSKYKIRIPASCSYAEYSSQPDSVNKDPVKPVNSTAPAIRSTAGGKGESLPKDDKQASPKTGQRSRSPSPCDQVFRRTSDCPRRSRCPTRQSACAITCSSRSGSFSCDRSRPSSMCSPCRISRFSPTRCPCPSFRPRSLSFTCLAPGCSICEPSCSSSCKCKVCCYLRTNQCPPFPRRCPAPKKLCCCAAIPRRRKPRSCPRPSICACCPSPCSPTRKCCTTSVCPCPAVTCCTSCPKSCMKACCRPCTPSINFCTLKTCCSKTPCCSGPSSCPFTCSSCPKPCRPSCCKPLYSVCTPGCNLCPASPCSLSSVGRYYDRSKRGDSLCKMLLSKYSYNKSSAAECFNTSPATACGGCRACAPCLCDDEDGAQAVPGSNRTNSRRLCSPGRQEQHDCDCSISFAEVPTNKVPYKEVDLSCAIYTPCVKLTGPRSPVQTFCAMKRAESPSPARRSIPDTQFDCEDENECNINGLDVKNVNNGAIQNEVDCHGLNHLRMRMEGHYVRRRCRRDQAQALKRYEHFFNHCYPDSNQPYNYLPGGCRYDFAPHSMNSYCRNNNFGEENFRFFRKYLNITPATNSFDDSSEVDPLDLKDTPIDESHDRDGDTFVQAVETPDDDKVEERISRLDKWILGKGTPSSPAPKSGKTKVAQRKKSGQMVGVTTGFRKPAATRTGQRKLGTSVGRNTWKSSTMDAELTKHLMIQKQQETYKLKSPQKNSDLMLGQAELNTPLATESPTVTKVAPCEEAKLEVAEAGLESPRKTSVCELKQYTPHFKQEDVVKYPSAKASSYEVSRVLDELANSPPVVIPTNIKRRGDGGDIATEDSVSKKGLGEVVIPEARKARNLSSASERLPGVNSRSKSHTEEVYRRTSSMRAKLPSPSPPLGPGESSVDFRDHNCAKPELSAPPAPPKKSSFMSTIKSLWGSTSKVSACSEDQPRVAGGISSEYILSGKESSVDLEYEGKKFRRSLDGSSNNFCARGVRSQTTNQSLISDYDEEYGHGSEVDYDVTARCSLESLVEGNKSRNRGGGSMESIHDVPSSSSQVNTDQMASPVSTMTGTVTTYPSVTDTCYSCSDACMASQAPSESTLSPSSSTQSILKGAVAGPLTNKVNSMNLQKLLFGSNLSWSKVSEEDVDVSSIRRAKEEFLRRQKRKKAAAAAAAAAAANADSSREDLTSVTSSMTSVLSQRPGLKDSCVTINSLLAGDGEPDDGCMDTASSAALCKQD